MLTALLPWMGRVLRSRGGKIVEKKTQERKSAKRWEMARNHSAQQGDRFGEGRSNKK